MDVLWSKDRLHKIFSKDSLAMTINAHASGDGSVTLRSCRLCGGDTSLRCIDEPYLWEGVEERYDQLLYDCFGVRVYPPDCLICDHCVRQLRNFERFRTLVRTAFAKQRSDYSLKHSQMGTGEGYVGKNKSNDDDDEKTVNRCKEVVKLRKRKSKTIDIPPKKREFRRDRKNSVMSTNVLIRRVNIACAICKQRYPMIVPFEGWKEFVCSRCKKNRAARSSVSRKCNAAVAPSVMREHLALHSKADLRGRSRLYCVSKKSTQLSKIEVSTTARQQKYQCSQCPKKYVVAQHLAHHINTVHGNGNYICTVCSKDLRSKELLDRHMRVHTGQPIYQCDVCMRTFKGKRTFQTHYLTHGK